MKQERLNEIVISINEPDDDVSKKLKLTNQEIEIRQRWRFAVAEYLNSPSMTDKELVDFIRAGCGGFATPVSKQAAYQDLTIIKSIVSKVNMASKEWWRYTVTEMAKEAYKVAKDQKDAKAMAMALDKIGKYQRVDQVDDNGFSFEDMIPPNFEFTPDVSVLNIKQMPDLEQRRRDLRKHFGVKAYMQSKMEDANEVTDDGSD